MLHLLNFEKGCEKNTAVADVQIVYWFLLAPPIATENHAMGGALSTAALAWLAVAQSPSPPRRYSEVQLPPEKVHGVIPGWVL